MKVTAGLLGKILTYYKSLSGRGKIVFNVTLITCLWFLTGINVFHKKEKVKQESKELSSVVVKKISPSKEVGGIKFYGETEAARSVELLGQVNSTISKIVVKDGAKVKQGDTIAVLEERNFVSQSNAAAATLKQKESDYMVAKVLYEKGIRSKNEFEQAKAAVEDARSNAKRASIYKGNTIIRAPFSGIVDKVYLKEGAFISENVGVKIAKVSDISKIKVSFHVSAQQALEITKGSEVVVAVRDKKYDAIVESVANTANEYTKSYEIKALITESDPQLLSGETAVITISPKNANTYTIEASCLNINEKGDIGVKIVNNSSVVEFVPVKILDDNEGTLAIQGLSGTVVLITSGGGFVKEGERVQYKLQ